MKNFNLVRVMAILIGFALAIIGHAAEVTPTQPEDEKSIRALMTAMGDAFAKLDAHAFSLVFHEDADFTNVWGMAAHGRKAIEEFHRPLLEGDGSGQVPSFKHAETKIVDTHIRFLRPDVAAIDATWTQTGAIQNGREMGSRKGLLMLIATKEADRWGIAVMHNMDLPVAK
jgi:uncharacterized protein (TIGR02246 family)